MLESHLSEARQLRDRALNRLTRANGTFINHAIDAVERVANRKSEFIIDDVWDEVRRYEQALETHTWPTDNRAIGAAIREAVKLGIIRATTTFRPSNQPQCHSNPRRVWQSLVIA